MKHNAVSFELGEARCVPRHTHENMEIFFLLRGRAFFELDGATFEMRDNDVIACNAGQTRAVNGGEPNLMLRLSISREYLLQETNGVDFVLQCNSCGESSRQNAPEYAQVAYLLRRMLIAYYQGGQRHTLALKSDLLQLLSFLQEHFHAPSSTENLESDGRVQAIAQQIRLRYREDISLQKIADAEHLSVHYLSRLFKKEMGKSFSKYLNEVRLAGSVHDLLHASDSVIKIALNNGFSSVSSFNRLFFQIYGQTPAKYRASRRIGQGDPTRQRELEQAFEESDDVVKYLRQFESKYDIKSEEKCSYSVNATAQATSKTSRPGTVVRVGGIHQLLKVDVQNQLKDLTDKMRISYVHTRCVFDDGMYSYESSQSYANFEYFQALDFLAGIRLVPYLQLVVDNRPAQEVVNRLERFLQDICGKYPPHERKNWMFELLFAPDASPDAVVERYLLVADTISRFLPENQVGLNFSQAISDAGAVAGMCKILKQCATGGYCPDRVTVYLRHYDPKNLAEDASYQLFRHMVSRQLSDLYEGLKQSGIYPPAIDLLQWNTLSGFTSVESNTFYRCALFLDELLHMPQFVEHVGFWLSTYVHEASTGCYLFDVVSLFLVDILKRPIYFALCLLELLYEDVVYQGDNLICTRNKSGDLSLLIINPCYFEPKMASDPAFVAGQRRVFDLHIGGLEGGKTISHHHIDNKKTALYDQWANMKFPALLTQSVIDQLRRTVHMELSIYEQTFHGTFNLSVALNFNEAAIVQLKNKY